MLRLEAAAMGCKNACCALKCLEARFKKRAVIVIWKSGYELVYGCVPSGEVRVVTPVCLCCWCRWRRAT